MKTLITVLCLVSMFAAMTPALAQDASEQETFVNTVKNRIHQSSGDAKGSAIAAAPVETTSVTRVELGAKGVVNGQSSFSFPMAPDKLADYLMTPEGAGKLSVIGHSAVPKGLTEDGKGWKGEIAVDLDQVTSHKLAMRALLSAESREMIKASAMRQFKAPFTATRETSGGVSTVHYTLADAKVVGQADLTLKIQANGDKGALVSVASQTRSALKDDGERLLLAKQVLRSIPSVLDEALTAQGR